MTPNLLLYVRSVGLALGAAVVVVGVGLLGEWIDVGPGRVPVWDPDGRGYWLTGLVVVVIVAAVYQKLDRAPLGPATEIGRSRPRTEEGEPPTRWILPALVVLAAVLFLGVYRGTTAIAVGALLAFAALTAGTISRHLMVYGSEAVREKARLAFTLVVHGAAFLTLSMIYIHKVRSVFSATAVLVVGVLLLLALTEGEHKLLQRRIVYALVGGLMLGQITWGLNYWQAAGWTGGAVLLICFYFVGGLILTHLRQGVQMRDVAEYGTVGSVAFAIVVFSLFT